MPVGSAGSLVLRKFCARQRSRCALGRQAGFVHKLGFWSTKCSKMSQKSQKSSLRQGIWSCLPSKIQNIRPVGIFSFTAENQLKSWKCLRVQCFEFHAENARFRAFSAPSKMAKTEGFGQKHPEGPRCFSFYGPQGHKKEKPKWLKIAFPYILRQICTLSADLPFKSTDLRSIWPKFTNFSWIFGHKK